MSRTVIINSDKSIGYLDDHKGHTLVGVREWDPGTAVKPAGAYVLEFSDKPAPQQIFTFEEQRALWEAIHEVKVNGENYHAFDEAIGMVSTRVFCNAYKREETTP